VFTAGEATVTRTSIHISIVSRTAIAALVGAALVSAALVIATPLGAAEWPNVRQSDTLWPMAPLGDPQWPQVPADSVKAIPASAPATVPASEPAKIAATTSTRDDNLTTGASLALPAPRPPVQAPPPMAAEVFERRFPSPFAFEGGARYWYSTGSNKFAFTNGNPLFGNPTSTLDWDRMTGHSGEVFARIDHLPSHLFVKGMLGGGVLKGGDMDDVDFLVTQASFSNTTSAINGNGTRYATVDIGYAFEVPSEGIRFGGFVGYQYWREKMTAFGVLCNADMFGNPLCNPAGSVVVPFSTPVDIFETTWHALRIGADARIRLYDRWTISGEIAIVPWAHGANDDSHLLRQSPADLGPAPNILSRTNTGVGGSAEAFVHYKVLPHFEIGVGARYWGLFSNNGSVQFGPSFTPDLALTRLSTQRYGVLLEAKASF
jgi:hypothetical protein